MDAERIRELFEGIAPVRVKRMFGGLGIFDGERMFALATDDVLYLKTDDATVSTFRTAGSLPFAFVRKGRPVETSNWSLPPSALDDPEELRRWTALARAAAWRG